MVFIIKTIIKRNLLYNKYIKLLNYQHFCNINIKNVRCTSITYMYYNLYVTNTYNKLTVTRKFIVCFLFMYNTILGKHYNILLNFKIILILYS